MAHSVPRNRVSGPVALGANQITALCLHCLSPSMCLPRRLSLGPLGPHSHPPHAAGSQSDPSENKSGGGNLPLRTF